MSVTHPFLKYLKAHILKFCSTALTGSPITDTHESLLPFCRILEDIFILGLRYTASSERTVWGWIHALTKSYATYKLTVPLEWCIENAAKSKQAMTDVGKTRLFLRSALNKGVLVLAIRLFKEKRQLVNAFYEKNSIIADDILFEMLASMLASAAQCRFSLLLKNACFLDATWELPQYALHEFVPTSRLGISILVADGRVVVMDVEEGSVADEDGKIEPGDVVDDLYGESMRNVSTRKFANLLRDYRGAPVYIGVVKCINSRGEPYRPMLPLLKEAGLSPTALKCRHAKRRKELQEMEQMTLLPIAETPSILQAVPAEVPTSLPQTAKLTPKIVSDQGLYPVKFLGYYPAGGSGGTDKIVPCVIEVLKTSNEDNKRSLLLDLDETDVRALCASGKQVVLQHGYPEIASCGRPVDYPLNFAYIAGETTCTLAKQFTCYVFEASCDEQSKIILQEISRGFERTHWAV